MPREAECARRIAAGICVECPTYTGGKRRRCPVCKDRERRRAMLRNYKYGRSWGKIKNRR